MKNLKGDKVGAALLLLALLMILAVIVYLRATAIPATEETPSKPPQEVQQAEVHRSTEPVHIFDESAEYLRVGKRMEIIWNALRAQKAAPKPDEEFAPEPLPEANPEPEPEVDEDELFCLAAVIYQEAGSNYICDECRYRVGDVVLNRVADERFPDTIREVLEQKAQYGMFGVTGVQFPPSAEYEPEAVERAYSVARDLLSDTRHSALYGAGYIWQAEFKQGTDIVYCCGQYFGR